MSLKFENRLGLPGYGRLLGCMPGTVEQIAAKMRAPAGCMSALITEIASVGAIHRSAVVKGKPRSAGVSVWTAGMGVNVPHPIKRTSVKKPRLMVQRFGRLVAVLQHGGITGELAEESGVDRRTVLRAIKALRRAGLVHIHGWQRGIGPMVPIYRWGHRNDATRPKPRTKQQINADYRAKQSSVVKINSAIGRIPVPSVWALAEAA